MEKAEGTQDVTLPPTPPIPPNVKPESMKPPKHSIVSRPGVGKSGRQIKLVAYHFEVVVNVTDASIQ
ncbi:protein argonaute 16-like protein [Corchorus olitorius]|uniref:Protein argonaute 16-like protein n=1 Tax=Corchorus olitorius TaxID=93759 RepID=A0A1R3FVR8_9ROSI|nr:protein argonaute 16-like protein [Corchorus olitorius]